MYTESTLRRIRQGEETIVKRQVPILRFPECLSGDGSLHLNIILTQYSHSVEEKDGNAVDLKSRKKAEWKKIGEDTLKLYESKALTDFRIQTRDGKTFDVHKAILGG
jgi:hypothetical protein